VLRHRRLGDLEPRGDLPRRQLCVGQIGEDLPAHAGGQGFEDLLHLSNYLRACMPRRKQLSDELIK
jgi:hypothetical protein